MQAIAYNNNVKIVSNANKDAEFIVDREYWLRWVSDEIPSELTPIEAPDNVLWYFKWQLMYTLGEDPQCTCWAIGAFECDFCHLEDIILVDETL